MCYSWIHPLPHSWNSFNRSHFSIYIHVYTIFPPYLPIYTLFLISSSSHWYQLPDLFCFLVLSFCKKKKSNVCLS
jgi:hypothetical protein